MLKQVDHLPEAESRSQVTVRHLRQVLLWPLRLIAGGLSEDDPRRRAPWQALHDVEAGAFHRATSGNQTDLRKPCGPPVCSPGP